MIALVEDIDKSDTNSWLQCCSSETFTSTAITCSDVESIQCRCLQTSSVNSHSMSSSSSTCCSLSSLQPVPPAVPMQSHHTSNPVIVHIDNPAEQYNHAYHPQIKRQTRVSGNINSSEYFTSKDYHTKPNEMDAEEHVRCHSQPMTLSNKFADIVLSVRAERRVEFSEMTANDQLNRRVPSRADNADCDDGGGGGLKVTSSPQETPTKRSNGSGSPSFATSLRDCKRLRAARRSSQERRVSLLGKPVTIRPHKQSNPFLKSLQNEIHNFLERPRGWKAMTYHIIM